MDIQFRHTVTDGVTIDRSDDEVYVIQVIRKGLVSGAKIVVTYDDGSFTEFNTKVGE